jgi:hypothetical protein
VEDIRRGLAVGAKAKPTNHHRGAKQSGADAEAELLRKVRVKLKAKLGR